MTENDLAQLVDEFRALKEESLSSCINLTDVLHQHINMDIKAKAFVSRLHNQGISVEEPALKAVIDEFSDQERKLIAGISSAFLRLQVYSTSGVDILPSKET